MFLIILRVLEQFNFNINVFNSKKFIKALLYEFEQEQEKNERIAKKLCDGLDRKIKEHNEKRLEENNNIER
jgi:hypothetical protein